MVLRELVAVIDHLLGFEQVDDRLTPPYHERDNEMPAVSSNSAMKVHRELKQDSRWRIGHQHLVDGVADRSHSQS